MDRSLILRGVFVVALVLGIAVGVASAALYYNSTEPGCDGSDPNVLWCDDFEDGVWYQTDHDHGGVNDPNNDGWGGNIFNSTPALAPNGTGAAGSCCAAASGPLNGGGGHMADHNLAPAANSYNELYMRHYRKMSHTQTGQEKFWTVNPCCAGIGGIKFTSHWTYPAGAGGTTGATLHLEVPAEIAVGGGLRFQNINEINWVTDGRWYYIEIHVLLNTPGVSNGVWEMWSNDCGASGVCTGSPTLRGRHTNVLFRASGDNALMGSVWLENWAPDDSFNTPETAFPTIGQEWYDFVKVSRVGPIGFAGTAAVSNTSRQTVPGGAALAASIPGRVIGTVLRPSPTVRSMLTLLIVALPLMGVVVAIGVRRRARR